MSWKDNVVEYGKQITAEITIENDDTVYDEDDIILFNPHYDANLYMSVMKVLDLELEGKHDLKGKWITSSKVGCKVGSGNYDVEDYIHFGEYYVKECDYEVDTKSTKCECYDKMISAMVPYEQFEDYDKIQYFQLCDKTKYSESQTINGITYTNNGDGTITANGTATADSSFIIETLSQDIYTSGNKVLITGCPANGGQTSYRITAFGQTPEISDSGAGVIAQLPSTTDYNVCIKIAEGTNADNLVFKPQIYDLTAMFGVGEEPETVSVFKAMFPKDLYDYDNGTEIIKPITVKEFLKKICTKFEWTLVTENFTNANIYIEFGENDIFDETYTYRDVLDQISQVVGGNLGFKTDGNLYVLYPPIITEYTEKIDESNLKSLKMGELYGPVNSLVLARTPQEDNIYTQDETSIEQNGLCEVRFENNQIIDKNRDAFINNLFDRINGTEYYLYELESFGIGYLDLCDSFKIVTADGTEYNTIMLRDDLQVTQGLNEKSLLEYPEKQTETDYTMADETDRRINQTVLQVDKQKQEIVALVSDMESKLALKVNSSSLSAEIQKEIKEAGEVKIIGKEFKFNEEGLTIKGSGQSVTQIETNISEDGMSVYTDTDKVLTANHDGVNARNLTANHYLIVGCCLFESYDNGTGEDRTGCFFYIPTAETPTE